jgi:hypothetical protein
MAMDSNVLVLGLSNFGIQIIWLNDQKEYYIPDTKNVTQVVIVSGILLAVIDHSLYYYQTKDGTMMYKWTHSVRFVHHNR